MTEENSYTSYLDFLSDKRFIAWKLAPTEELNHHWQTFSSKNPALQQEMRRAEEYLKKNILNTAVWNENEYAELWQKIHLRTNHLNKKRYVRRIIYTATAACVVIALSIGGFYLWFKNNSTEKLQTEWIEGCQLNEEDICLVTSTSML